VGSFDPRCIDASLTIPSARKSKLRFFRLLEPFAAEGLDRMRLRGGYYEWVGIALRETT